MKLYVSIVLALISASPIYGQIKDSIATEQADTIKFVRHVYSDKIEASPDRFEGNQLFTGDVKFEHVGSFLVCDSAVYYQEKQDFFAFSNTRIYNDSVSLSAYSIKYNSESQVAVADKDAYLVEKNQTLRSDQMVFDRKTQIATAIGNVFFSEGSKNLSANKMIYNQNTDIVECIGDVVFNDADQNLKTQRLIYNQKTGIVTYSTGAVIKSKDGSIVKSRIGVYNVRGNTNTLKGNVEIENNDFRVLSPRADYNSASDKVTFTGPTVISSKKDSTNYIETDKGIYFNKTKKAYLKERSRVHYQGKILTGDDIFYNQNTGFGRAEGNVVISDPEEDRVIRGDYGEAFKNIDSAFVTGHAYAAKNFSGDTLYLHADTLVAVRAKNEKGLIRAFRNAKMYKSDVQAKSDSISFDEENGVITFFRKPVVWLNESQITGDTIKIYNTVGENRLDSVRVYENAFAISKVDTLRDVGFHQIKSKYLNAYVENKELKYVRAKFNAQSLTFLEDTDKKTNKKKLIGINQSNCGYIESEFVDRQIDLVACLVGAKSILYTLEELSPEKRFLPGFKWRGEERLKSMLEMFDKEEIQVEEDES